MPTRNISLTPEQDAFLDSVLKTGEYQSASEAMRDAVRALQLRREEDRLKLERLRLALAEGLRDLDSGNYVEVDAEELDAYFDSLPQSAP